MSVSKSRRLLDATEFVAFDLETTGLFPFSGRIVEFGAVRFTLKGTELDVFDQLVDPECRIPADATRIHGITDAMVRGRPTAAEVLPRFLAFLGNRNTVLLAHNASFDLGFVNMAMSKLRLPGPTHKVVDTLGMSRKCLPRLGSHCLEEVARHLRVAKSADHRGLSDSRLAMGIFRRLVRRKGQWKTLGHLFDALPPLIFAEVDTSLPTPPAGFECLSIAITEQRTVIVMYEAASKGVCKCRVTPRNLMQYQGRAYMTALCHYSDLEKTYRLDRIQELWLEE